MCSFPFYEQIILCSFGSNYRLQTFNPLALFFIVDNPHKNTLVVLILLDWKYFPNMVRCCFYVDEVYFYRLERLIFSLTGSAVLVGKVQF
jgi:hypothetical protein